MLSIRTVLCPVDFSTATARQVEVSADLCHAFGARLVLHHNLVELAIGAGVGWMWAAEHRDFERVIEQRLIDLVPKASDAFRTEVRLSHGPVVDGVLAIAEAVDADLVVLAACGTASGLDGSVTERVIEHAVVPVFAIHDVPHERQAPHFSSRAAEVQTLLVPTDLSPASQPALNVACDLARRFPFTVHLLHVLPEAGRTADSGSADEVRRQVAAAAPADLPRGLGVSVERGVPADVIARVARDLPAACIVMGEHARTPLRHWFRPDTSRGVLHPAPCPIWYVPTARSAAALPSSELAVPAVERQRRVEAPTTPGMRLVDALRDDMFHYWPAHRVYGVVDSPDAAESALVDLIRAGVPRSQLQTWHGREGRDAIDPTGEGHGRAARLWRALERATPERALLDRYASEIEHGHVCIGVRCNSGAGPVIAGILQKYGGHLISYFSVGSVEHLSS